MKALARLLPVLALATPTSAHVGSPDVFLEGDAGSYHLFVTVRLPQVIPGVAAIEIRSQSPGIRELKIVPSRLTGAGSQYTPAPDLAERSPSDPQFFTGSLWLMEGGSLEVKLQADGERGRGDLAVPVPSIAQRVLPMQRGLGISLFILMLLLAVGAVSIVAVGAREGTLQPGRVPGGHERRRAWIAALVTALAVTAILAAGNWWWRLEASAYAGSVYRPPRLNTVLQPDGRLILRGEGGRIAVRPGRGDAAFIPATKLDDLVPDHQHLMHLFLVLLPGMDRLYHLHPAEVEKGVFVQDLPTLPGGLYQAFADIVHSSGFPETMAAEVALPAISGKPLFGDDSEVVAPELGNSASDTLAFPLPRGARMVWERGPTPLRVGVPMSFRFRIEDAGGNPATDLEPYMGMAGHAEFIRSDCSVFAHVHPAGTVPMAALDLAQSGGSAMASSMSLIQGMSVAVQHPLPPEVSFPYGFPRPGIYRIFVQVKRAGEVQTGVFTAHVQ